MKLGTLVKPVLIVGLLFAGQVMAASSAQQALSASPIDDIVKRYPDMMSEGIREGLTRRQQLPPMVADTIGFVVKNSFSASAIEQEIVNKLEEDLSEEQLEAVESWYRTPVARKISAAEIAASDPAVWKEVQSRSRELDKRYRGTERARMFQRFDRAARATDSAVDTSIAVQLGLATAMAAFSSDSENYDALRQKIENQRDQIRGMVEQQVYNSYLYTYENISDQEMGLYMDFLESGPGSAFSKSVTVSIQQAITEPVESIGKQVSRFLSPEQ